MWTTIFEFQSVFSARLQYPWVICDLLPIVCDALELLLLLDLFFGVNCGFVGSFQFRTLRFRFNWGCRFVLYEMYLGLRLHPLPYLDPEPLSKKNGFEMATSLMQATQLSSVLY